MIVMLATITMISQSEKNYDINFTLQRKKIHVLAVNNLVHRIYTYIDKEDGNKVASYNSNRD